jgi:hypothetical protein
MLKPTNSCIVVNSEVAGLAPGIYMRNRPLSPVLKKIEQWRSSNFELRYVVQLLKHFFNLAQTSWPRPGCARSLRYASTRFLKNRPLVLRYIVNSPQRHFPFFPARLPACPPARLPACPPARLWTPSNRATRHQPRTRRVGVVKPAPGDGGGVRLKGVQEPVHVLAAGGPRLAVSGEM